MRDTHAQLLPGAMGWLVLALTLSAPGQDVAQPPSPGETPPAAGVLQELVPLGDGPLLPVTAEHQGRLLVLTYGLKSSGGLMADPNPRREPRRFVIYQGQRQIASGQFEYG